MERMHHVAELSIVGKVPCLALPCLALPCLALPCLALPCLTCGYGDGCKTAEYPMYLLKK